MLILGETGGGREITGQQDSPRPPPGAQDLVAHVFVWVAHGQGVAMNGRLVGEHETGGVHVAASTGSGNSSSAIGIEVSGSKASGPRPGPRLGPRRARLIETHYGEIRGPLSKDCGGEFTFEIIENYPTLGISGADDGSGTIINPRGQRGTYKHIRNKYKRTRKPDLTIELRQSSKKKSAKVDPYLPGLHLLCDMDTVASSVHLKSYPVCEPDLFDVNSKFNLNLFYAYKCVKYT